MASSFFSGQLPEPLRKPVGKPDEVAAALAKQVAAGDDQSVPALLTAIMMAGFGIRDSDGSVTQTIQPGQGLVFEAWEIASMAKMYGERRTVELSYLSNGLKSIPALKQAPLEKFLLDGVRKQAVSEQPELRFWGRFILELGRQSEEPYDLLGVANVKGIHIDAIQAALIMRRLAGDVYTLGQRGEQGFRRSGGRDDRKTVTAANYDGRRQMNAAHAAASPTQPCTLSDMESTVADLKATMLTTAFDELMSFAKDKIQGSAGELFGNYKKFVNIANILLAYAKFIATYAALETEITVENPPLIRNTDVTAGQRRRLNAKVKMNVGKWQQVNCFRWLLNAGTGMDFNLMNDGPLGNVDVNWHLVEGGAADFYSGGDRGQQIVWFVGTGPRIQDAGTYAGAEGAGDGTRVGILTRTKTDESGNAHIFLEGASRREYIPAPHLPVMKHATVQTTVKLKGGDIKGDASDIAGHVFGGIISLTKGEGFGGSAGGMFTLPLELLYRTDWASTATIEVPVKDWQTCESDAWEGTITYRHEWNFSRENHGPKGHDETTRKESYSATLIGGERISQSGVVNVNNADIKAKASYNEKYSSGGGVGCYRPNQRSIDLVGDSQSTAGSVSVRITPDMRYRVYYHMPTVSVEGWFVSSWHLEGDCHNPFMDKSGGSKSLMSHLVTPLPLEIEGGVDPNNPRVLTGSKTITIDRDEGPMTITVSWNLSHCTTH